MPDVSIDKELAQNLQEAKKKPRNFAILAKGPNVVKLLVSKKPIKDGDVLKAKKECQANLVCRGVCVGAGPELVFHVTEDQPAVAEPKFKAFLKEQSGLALKPRFEIVTALPSVQEDEPEGPTPVPPGPAPSLETPQDDAVPPPPLGKPPDLSGGPQVLAALNKLTPNIKAAVAAHPERKADVVGLISAITRAVQNGDVPGAKTQLAGLLQLLKDASGPKPAPDPLSEEKQGESLVALQKSRLAWDALRKRVQSELQALEQAILSAVRAHNADETAEDEYDEVELAAGVKQLYTILEKLDERLIDKLDEALNASGEQRRDYQAQAAGIIQEYQAFVDADPLLTKIDENGFTKATIRKSVIATLTALSGKL